MFFKGTEFIEVMEVIAKESAPNSNTARPLLKEEGSTESIQDKVHVDKISYERKTSQSMVLETESRLLSTPDPIPIMGELK